MRTTPVYVRSLTAGLPAAGIETAPQLLQGRDECVAGEAAERDQAGLSASRAARAAALSVNQMALIGV
jgi:hypothetical protein